MITILRRCVLNKINDDTWSSRSQHDLLSCPPHNFVIWRRILQIFHRNDHHIGMTCRPEHLGCYLEGQGHSMTLQQNRVWPITLLFEVGFYNCVTEMITILGWYVASKFGSLPWRSQHDLAAKTCPAYNFVIWSQILQLLDKNDHHIEMMSHYLAHSLALGLLYCIMLSSVTLIASFSGLQEEGMIRAWNNLIDRCTT